VSLLQIEKAFPVDKSPYKAGAVWRILLADGKRRVILRPSGGRSLACL